MKDSHLPRTRTPEAKARDMKESIDARRSPLGVGSKLAGGLAVGAAVGTLLILGGRGGESGKQGSAAPGGTSGNVPAATMGYLKGLPTERTEIPEGGGIDDAAYAVDPETFDDSANIRAGVEKVIADELRPADADSQDNFVVPAGAEVDVPVVPPIDSVPPDAR